MSYSQILKKEYQNDPNEYIKEVYEVNAASKLVTCPSNGRVMKIDNIPAPGQTLQFKQQNAGTLQNPDALTFGNLQPKAISRQLTSNQTIDPVAGTQVDFNALNFDTSNGDYGTNPSFVVLPDQTVYNVSSYIGVLVQPTASKFVLEIQVILNDGTVGQILGVSTIYVDAPLATATQYYVSTSGMGLCVNNTSTINIKVIGELISGASFPSIIANAGSLQVSSGMY